MSLLLFVNACGSVHESDHFTLESDMGHNYQLLTVKKLDLSYKSELRINISLLLLHSLNRRQFIFINGPSEIKNEMMKMMLDIKAILEKHSRAEVKWGVFRDRQISSEVWEKERERSM